MTVMQTRRGCEQDATSSRVPEAGGRGISEGPAAVTAGRPVMVEVYLLRCHRGGQLAYRCVTGQLGAAETPDEAALRIGRIAPDGPGAAVAVHSTSWRHLGDGSIVLAYAIAPDPVPDATAVPILSFEAAHGPCATRPSPERLEREQVAAHAARHLALVADANPDVRQVLDAYPELARSLDELPRAAAGQLAAR